MANRHEPIDEQKAALLAAARNYFSESPVIIKGKSPYAQMLEAIDAYYPPKPKKYVLPEWEVFLRGKEVVDATQDFGPGPSNIQVTWVDEGKITRTIWKSEYNAIREATGE